MGAWLKVNGEAIYGTQPTLFGAGGRRVLRHRERQERQAEVRPRVELALHHAPGQNLHRDLQLARGQLPSGQMLPRKVTKAYLLADSAHTPLKLTAAGGALDVQLPAKAPDPIATVLVLETAK